MSGLPPAQRVAFGLACAEHVLPSFDLQVRAYPATVPSGTLPPAALHACVDALWASLVAGSERLPECLTEEHALAAGSDAADGLSFLVPDTLAVVFYAMRAFERVEACLHAGQRALQMVDELVLRLLVPKGAAYPDDDAVAGHPLVRLERGAQEAAIAALDGGIDLLVIRTGARSTGDEIAATAVSLLRSLRSR